jgi:hypothetical protein
MSEIADIPDGFWPRFEDLVRKCGILDGLDLLGVWMSESGLRATAHNPSGHASGIFQAMPRTLFDLGFAASAASGEARAEAFRLLNAAEQLPWAERYYAPARGRLVNKAACYMWTFLPADISLASDGDSVIVAKKGSAICPDGRRSNVFDVNSAFDRNGDQAIQVRELESAIQRACRGPRWSAIVDRWRLHLGLQPGVPPTIPPPNPDLRTLRGIQEALLSLGFTPGPADGAMGLKTRSAVMSFQASVGLVADGAPGPLTRDALRAAIAKGKTT